MAGFHPLRLTAHPYDMYYIEPVAVMQMKHQPAKEAAEPGRESTPGEKPNPDESGKKRGNAAADEKQTPESRSLQFLHLDSGVFKKQPVWHGIYIIFGRGGDGFINLGFLFRESICRLG